MRASRAAGSTFDRCINCGYAVLHSTPSRADYWEVSEETDSGFWVASKTRYFASALDLISDSVPGRRLVDVGGGVGHFAELALQRGWDAVSIDPSPTATASAAERIGSDRAMEDLDGVRPGSFDVASLWCVVAHVDDPVELLARVARVLRSGGAVWITTPNFAFQAGFGAARAIAGRPIDFALDDHRGQFGPRSLTQLLVRTGFRAPSFHYRGITEFCGATMRTGASVGLKRTWNRTAFVATTLGLPNLMSELQALAIRV
jgi:SAM-dependent methyltransferase